MTEEAPSSVDARSVITDRSYRMLLLLSAVVGVVVSIAAWAFLTLVPWLQDLLYVDLPDWLGFSETPWWWPIPVLVIAGVITGYVILNLPGHGGGIPANGLAGGSGLPEPRTLPGVLLAGLVTLGFGLVLGPSSPVIALGMGLGLLIIRTASSDIPESAQQIVAMAGAFAALAMVFGNPIIAAIILIEAAALTGAMAPVIVLPGLLAAGIGSLVYLGMGNLTGLSTEAYALLPLRLPAVETLTIVEFVWAVVLAIPCALLGVGVIALGKRLHRIVRERVMVWVPVMGAVVAVLAILFAQITGESALTILFSGSRALNPVVGQADTLAVATVAWLLLFKAAAWSVSMGSFRGGPVFPAVFIGVVVGVLASSLPALSLGAAVPIALAATVVAVLRLPLSACVIGVMLTASAGLEVMALVITAMVVSYVSSEALRRQFPSVEEEALPAV